MTISFIKCSKEALPAYVVTPENLQTVLDELEDSSKNWAISNKFLGNFGQGLVCPDQNGQPKCALLGLGTAKSRTRERFTLASAASKLPEGTYFLQNNLNLENCDYELLGWLMLGYSFDRYRKQFDPGPRLMAPDWADVKKIEAMAKAESICCDLINTPASDMSPADLENSAKELADTFGASFSVIKGEDLLKKNFPMIHSVGRAAQIEPRLIELRHGSSGPKISLVGKGVCFDTGGLNMKTGSSMGLMKKDMGGAANIIALAYMLMQCDRPYQLQVLIPAIENSVDANSFRPQDVLRSRKGLSVEINNTDAEGRLVLADALTYAGERDPDLIISMATLTGAARVAVGTDLAPFYAGSDLHAQKLMSASMTTLDPLWQMPFWDPYDPLIEPSIADLDNAEQQRRVSNGRSVGTVGREVSTLSAIFSRAIAEYSTTDAQLQNNGNPFSRLRGELDKIDSDHVRTGQRQAVTSRAWTPDELASLEARLWMMNEEAELCTKLAMFTGARLKDVTGLMIDELKLDTEENSYINFKHNTFRTISKDSIERRFPLYGDMLSDLKDYVSKKDFSLHKKLTPRYAKHSGSSNSLSQLLNIKHIDKFSKDPSLIMHGIRDTLQAKFDAAQFANKVSGYLIGWKNQETVGMQSSYNKQGYPHKDLLEVIKKAHAISEWATQRD